MSVIVMSHWLAACGRLPTSASFIKLSFTAAATLFIAFAGASQANAAAIAGKTSVPVADTSNESGFEPFFWGEPRPEPVAPAHHVKRFRHQAPQSPPSESGSVESGPSFYPTHSGSSAVLNEANRWVGHGNVTGTHRAWCADFANWVLTRTGHRASGSGMVGSLLSVGARVSSPSPGDIVVMRGHVTIFAGYGGRGFYGVGGNQHHRVAKSNYPLRSVVAFVRPN